MPSQVARLGLADTYVARLLTFQLLLYLSLAYALALNSLSLLHTLRVFSPHVHVYGNKR